MCLSQKCRAEGHRDTCLKTMIYTQLLALHLLAFLQNVDLASAFFFLTGGFFLKYIVYTGLYNFILIQLPNVL